MMRDVFVGIDVCALLLCMLCAVVWYCLDVIVSELIEFVGLFVV